MSYSFLDTVSASIKTIPLAAKQELSYADWDGETIISKGRAYQCFRDNIDRYILLPGL